MQLYIRKTSLINPNRFKYRVNQDFFKHWSPQMAYVLGFIFADGNIHGVSLSLDLKDDKDNIELLRKIKKAMGANYPIGEMKNSFRLKISNPSILQDVQKLGVIPNKTKTCLFPNIPEEFLRDFIRGFLDGDGWITVRKEKMEISVGFSNGSCKFLEALGKKLSKSLSLTTNNLRIRKKTTKKNKISITYSIEWFSRNAFRIIKFLYNDLKKDDLFLHKKYQRQLEAREIYKESLRGSKKYREVEKRYKLPMQKLLQKLFIEDRFTGEEIAKKLGIHSSSVYRWLEKTGVKFPEKKIKKIIVKECPVCHGQFEQQKGRFKKYCSEYCRIQARQTGKLVKCIVCGKKVYRPGWWFRINNTPICSKGCLREWRRMRVGKNTIHRSKETVQFVSFKRGVI